MAGSTENPWTTVDPWEVSTGVLLGIGDHIVTIIEAEDASSNNGNPKLIIKYENAHGSRQDWIPYSSTFMAKAVALMNAAGVALPEDGEFDPNDNCRLSAAKIREFINKKVGAVVREEPDDREPGKMRIVTKGYVEPARITDDMPADTRGLATSAAGVKDDTVPF